MIATWFDLLAFTTLLLGIWLYLYARMGRRMRLAAKVRAEVARQRAQLQSGLTAGPLRPGASVMRGLHWLGVRVPIFSLAQRSEILRQLVAAGFRSRQALVTIMAVSLICVLLFALLPVVFVWPLLVGYPLLKPITSLLCAYLGSLLPRMLLDWWVRRRQQAIAQALPDALDLLLIATNAGLGLNSAIKRAADELVSVHPALADELNLTASELNISSDVEAVLTRLAERVQLESVQQLIITLLQSRRYGTPITQALRILARSERTARMVRLEEAAAKLSVKITLPMMLFILPTVLIVSAGPAVIGMMDILAIP